MDCLKTIFVLIYALLIDGCASQMVIVNGRDNSKNLQKNYAVSLTLDFFGIGSSPASQCAYYIDNRCAFCQDGYQLNQFGECEEIFQRCRIYWFNKFCLECHPYFYLENGVCMDGRCLNTGFYICRQCKPGFIRTSNGFCIDKQCVTYRNGQCITCRNNFTKNQETGLCQLQQQPSPQNNTTNNISSPNIPQNSSSLPTNKSIITGTIILNSQGFYIYGCQIYNLKLQCMKCNEDFKMIGGRCISLGPCLEFDESSGLCVSCLEGYLLREGNCYLQAVNLHCKTVYMNRCIQCIDRYYLAKQTCLQINPNCKDYDKYSGKCFTCFEGYVLISEKCQKININPQQQVFNASLLPVPLKTNEMLDLLYYYCLKWNNKSRKCQKCYDSYYLIEGVCQRVSQLCLTYNVSTGLCITCLQGYILTDNGKCQPNKLQNPQLNCQIYNQPQNSCQTCKKGYFLYQSHNCLRINPSCYQYDPQTSLCISCWKGFYFSEGYCQIIATKIAVPFCNRYNPVDPRECLSCVYGFYLEDNRCLEVGAFCLGYRRDNGECQICRQGYTVQNGICIHPETAQTFAPNCAQYNQIGHCLKCQQNYTLFDYICRDSLI